MKSYKRRVVNRLPWLQQAHGLGTGPDTFLVQAFAVVRHGQDDFVAFLN